MDGQIYKYYLIDDDLSTVTRATVETVRGHLSDLQTINTEIQKLLEDENWQGDAHNKCEAAIGMMETYRADLDSFCDEFDKNLKNLVDNANDFVSNSEKEASIREV